MNNPTLELALDTIQKQKQALIFVTSRASAEKVAEDISRVVSLGPYVDLEKEVLSALSTPTKQCERLAQCIRKGIAFHHSGLTEKQRSLIEKEFRNGKVAVICCTPTLAFGVNTPAYRVIMNSLKRYSQTGWGGMQWIPVLEYHQCAGRAGRPDFGETVGEVVSIAKSESEKDEIQERYINGEVEDIYSKLAVEPVLRTYVLSLIATGVVRTTEQLFDFFSKTFWAHQYKDMNQLQIIIERMIHFLEQCEFITISGPDRSDFVSAGDLGKGEQLRATLVGKRVSELYLDPLTAQTLLDGLRQYQDKQPPFSLMQLVSHTLEMRPLLRVGTRDYEHVQEQLVAHYDELLLPEPSLSDPRYEDFMASIKTTLFFEAWLQEGEEAELLEKHDIRPGEIKVKIDIADWLLYALGELATLVSRPEVGKDIHRLRIRLQYGVREELLPLLQLKGIGRKRARRLYAQGIKNLGDVVKTDLSTLEQLVGKAVAASIKQQMHQEITEIQPGKRKGQLAMTKFSE